MKDNNGKSSDKKKKIISHISFESVLAFWEKKGTAEGAELPRGRCRTEAHGYTTPRDDSHNHSAAARCHD